MAGLLERLLGNRALAAKLSPEQNGDAQRRGLLDAGLATISGASRGQGLFPALAGGIAQGRQSYDAEAQGAIGANQDAQQQEIASALGASGGPETPEQRLQRVLQMADKYAASGNTEQANKLYALVAGAQSLFHGPEQKNTEVNPGGTLVGPDGRPIFQAPFSPAQMREGGTTPYQNFMMGEAGRDNFRQLLSPYWQESQMLNNVSSIMAPAFKAIPDALRGDGIAQLTLIYGYLKAVDPGSVVREGEITNVTKTASMPADLWKELTRIAGVPENSDKVSLSDRLINSKAPLIPTTVAKSLASELNRNAQTWKQKQQDLNTRYQKIGQSTGVDFTPALVDRFSFVTPETPLPGADKYKAALDAIVAGGK